MNSIKKNLNFINYKISKIAEKYKKNEKKIQLIAVTKNQSINLIKEAINYKQFSFAENYVQEGKEKIELLSKYSYINWHFIGRLQSNKTRFIAENFSWCQTIDRLNIAKRLNKQIPNMKPKLNVLIQININNEKTKAGISLNELHLLSKEISFLPNLILRGIMVFPSQIKDHSYQSKIYKKIEIAFNILKSQYNTVDTLSLGTSNDIEISIASGSTMLRVGSAIFGNR